jgi:hypothetical protein
MHKKNEEKYTKGKGLPGEGVNDVKLIVRQQEKIKERLIDRL